VSLHFQHLAAEQLADFAEGHLSGAERAEAETHLAACPRCSARAASFKSIVDLMRTDDTRDAPDHVINRAIRAFRTEQLTMLNPQPGRGIRQRLLAMLRFDSAQQALAMGRRAGQTSERELLYAAGDSMIEVRIDRSEAGWTVGGQILGSCGGGEARIEGVSGTATTQLNELCEFNLPPLADGIYLLILRLDDVDVEVPGLELLA
jgi:hypothetical protein